MPSPPFPACAPRPAEACTQAPRQLHEQRLFFFRYTGPREVLRQLGRPHSTRAPSLITPSTHEGAPSLISDGALIDLYDDQAPYLSCMPVHGHDGGEAGGRWRTTFPEWRSGLELAVEQVTIANSQSPTPIGQSAVAGREKYLGVARRVLPGASFCLLDHRAPSHTSREPRAVWEVMTQ